MRKFLLATITCILVACCSLMVACGATGTYKFDSMSGSMGGVSVEVKAGDVFMGETFSADYMVLELEKDGKGKMTSMGMSQDVTWEKDGKVIKVTAEGETIEFTKDGDTLVMEEDGIKVVLKK